MGFSEPMAVVPNEGRPIIPALKSEDSKLSRLSQTRSSEIIFPDISWNCDENTKHVLYNLLGIHNLLKFQDISQKE